MRLFSMFFAWVFGWGEPSDSERPEITPSYLTTDSATDTGDTGEPLDTAEETGETGETETGDSGDTADTALTTDTALKSAMELAGENGGFGCATVSPDAAASILVGLVALGLRRRD